MSIFLSNCHHAFAKTDGSMDWPNSLEGDLLKQGHKEVKEAEAEMAFLIADNKRLRAYLKTIAVLGSNSK